MPHQSTGVIHQPEQAVLSFRPRVNDQHLAAAANDSHYNVIESSNIVVKCGAAAGDKIVAKSDLGVGDEWAFTKAAVEACTSVRCVEFRAREQGGVSLVLMSNCAEKLHCDFVSKTRTNEARLIIYGEPRDGRTYSVIQINDQA